MAEKFIEYGRGGKLGRGGHYWRAVGGNGHMMARSRRFTAEETMLADARQHYPDWPMRKSEVPLKPRKMASQKERTAFFAALSEG